MTATAAETVPPRAKVSSRAVLQNVVRLRAPFALRCGAILTDYIIFVAIIAFGTLVSRLLGGGARSAGSSSETIGIFLAVVGVMPGLTGLTIGKWATGLHIRRTDGSDIGIGRAFVRHFVGYPISFLILGLGFLLAALMPSGRGLHDFIAGTIVVREVPRDVRGRAQN
jgi:uncharacterized RDD family membrane protein YckC